MKRVFTLEYWTDDGWFVGRLKEVPSVMGQGETLHEFKDNIIDAYHMMRDAEDPPAHPDAKTLELGVELWNAAHSFDL